jgi:hypothetical protein
MRAPVCAVVVMLLLASLAASPAAMAQAAAQESAVCAKADFEAVVNAAGAALRDLTQQNRPVLLGKLHQLKDKRSWTSDEFPKQVQAIVSDETTAGFDKKSEELVARISSGGGRGEAETAAPDCTLLTGLQADLKLLVETQQAKWAHTFARIDQELAR